MDHVLQTVLGQNLRTIRLQLGLTQEEMAGRLGIHRTYLGGLERGERNPTLQTVEGLSTLLGVPPVDLLWDRARIVVTLAADGTPHLTEKDA